MHAALRHRIIGKANATTFDLAYNFGDKYEHGTLQNVVVIDKTNAATRCEIFLDHRGYEQYMGVISTLVANVPKGLNEDLVIVKGEFLIFRFIGVTINDDIEVYLNGFYDHVLMEHSIDEAIAKFRSY